MVGTQNHGEKRYARRNTMAIGSDHVIITGSERPARSDAKLVGPADTSERVMVSVEVRQRPDAPPLPDLAALGAQPPRQQQRIDLAALAARDRAGPADLAHVAHIDPEHDLT